MRRIVLLFALLAGLMGGGSFTAAQAQTAPPVVASLQVELWPDYDQPAILVLLTAVLTPDTPLPATMTLPLPPEADLHVVARLNASGQLVDDVVYTLVDGQLTFTIANPGFRVEYYLPHGDTADQRDFTWAWATPFAVEQLLITVQEPLAAEGFQLDQTAEGTRTNSDGLRYHDLPARAVLAGESIAVQMSYTLPNGQLSRLPAGVAPAANSAPTAEPSFWQDNWPLIVLGTFTLILSLLLIRQGLQERTHKRPLKPRPTPTTTKSPASFCTQCGHPLPPKAQFCPSCGHKV